MLPGFALVAIALLVAVGCGTILGGSDRPGRVLRAGEVVTVGAANWRVLYVRRTPTLARQFSGANRARGIFVLIEIRAERVAVPGPINSRPLTLVDDRGRIFRVSRSTTTAVDDAGLKPLAVGRIAPRTRVTGWVAFDVGADARAVRLRIGDMDRASADYAYIRLP